MANLPLDQTSQQQHHHQMGIAKLEPTTSTSLPVDATHEPIIEKFYEDEDDELEKHFEKSLMEPKRGKIILKFDPSASLIINRPFAAEIDDEHPLFDRYLRVPFLNILIRVCVFS